MIFATGYHDYAACLCRSQSDNSTHIYIAESYRFAGMRLKERMYLDLGNRKEIEI